MGETVDVTNFEQGLANLAAAMTFPKNPNGEEKTDAEKQAQLMMFMSFVIMS